MKKIITFFMLSLLVFSASSQDSCNVLSIEKAVNLAIENNLDIKQSKMDLDILATKNKYSWNSLSPTISASGGFSGQDSFSIIDGFSFSEPSWSYNLGVSVGVNFTPAVKTTMKAAQLNYENGQSSLENTKRTVELNIRKSFYSLVYFNKNLEIKQRSLDTAKQTYEANLVKYKQGRLSELDLLTSQYNYESKIPDVENLKTTYQKSMEDFKILLGIDLSEEIELEANLDDVISIQLDESILQSSIENNSSIKSLKQNILIKQNSIQASKYSAYSPSVSFNLSETTNGSSKENTQLNKKAWIPSSSISYGLTVRIPLDGYFSWSSGKINIETSNEELEKLKMNLEQTRIKVTQTVKNNYISILQAQQQLSLLEKTAELTQKTYDMSKKAYNMGSVDLITLQQKEDNLYTADYNVQNQKYQILLSILTLEETLGIPYGTLGK